MMYPYYPVTENPLIDSLFARPDQVDSGTDWILPLAMIGFALAFIVGVKYA